MTLDSRLATAASGPGLREGRVGREENDVLKSVPGTDRSQVHQGSLSVTGTTPLASTLQGHDRGTRTGHLGQERAREQYLSVRVDLPGSTCSAPSPVLLCPVTLSSSHLSSSRPTGPSDHVGPPSRPLLVPLHRAFGPRRT